MTFQIHALDPAPFEHLFSLSDEELHALRARRMTVTENPGTPCRVTLADAEIGEEVILTNFTHLETSSPFHATHAIFLRPQQDRVEPAPGELPPALQNRMLSLRALDASGMIRDGQVIAGTQAAPLLTKMLNAPDIEQVHLHFAGPGCYAARATLR